MHPFIHIGRHIHIPVYNLCIGAGIVCAMLLLDANAGFRSFNHRDRLRIHLSLLLTIFSGFVGAYLFDAFTQRRSIALQTGNAGFTLEAGMIAGIICLACCFRLSRLPVLALFNLLTPSFAIAHCLGRIGCFCAGCCFGKPGGLMAVCFPAGSLPALHYHAVLKLMPTQLYESAFALLMCVLLLVRKPAQGFAIYIAAYAIFRFFLEYLRNDDRGIIAGGFPFSPSQLLSMILLTASMVIFSFVGRPAGGPHRGLKKLS